MADRGGLLTRASAAIGKFILKRELVGVDALGNKYYKYEHPHFLLSSLLTYLHTHSNISCKIRYHLKYFFLTCTALICAFDLFLLLITGSLRKTFWQSPLSVDGSRPQMVFMILMLCPPNGTSGSERGATKPHPFKKFSSMLSACLAASMPNCPKASNNVVSNLPLELCLTSQTQCVVRHLCLLQQDGIPQSADTAKGGSFGC